MDCDDSADADSDDGSDVDRGSDSHWNEDSDVQSDLKVCVSTGKKIETYFMILGINSDIPKPHTDQIFSLEIFRFKFPNRFIIKLFYNFSQCINISV